MGPLTFRHPILLTVGLLLFLWLVPVSAATVTGQASWIYDGDTLKIEGIGKVRLIGIDAPEREASSRDRYYSERYQISPEHLRITAKQSLDYNIRHVKGKNVRLAFDIQRQDKYGRTLAYVYLPDGALLNRLLIEHGLATVYRRYDFRLKKNFLAAEEKARQAGVGLWSQ